MLFCYTKFKNLDLKGIVKGVTNQAADKVGLLSKEIKQLGVERLKICSHCDIFEPETATCSAKKGGCGCSMKKKVLVKGARCPHPKGSKW